MLQGSDEETISNTERPIIQHNCRKKDHISGRPLQSNNSISRTPRGPRHNVFPAPVKLQCGSRSYNVDIPADIGDR